MFAFRFLFVFTVLFVPAVIHGMTRAQLKKTLTIMKKQCMPKTGVNESKVGQIEQGVFLEERNVKCYIACIYKTIQVVKNNKLNKELISKQVDILYPEDMRASVKAGVEVCFPIQEKYDDMCDAVFYATKCLYEFDPPNFVFP